MRAGGLNLFVFSSGSTDRSPEAQRRQGLEDLFTLSLLLQSRGEAGTNGQGDANTPPAWMSENTDESKPELAR